MGKVTLQVRSIGDNFSLISPKLAQIRPQPEGLKHWRMTPSRPRAGSFPKDRRTRLSQDSLRINPMAEHRPHLALLDLALPGSDGIELMHQVQRIADVPVIFLSVYGQDDTVARAFDMGAADYLVKPFSPTELSARIRAALRKGVEPSPDEPMASFAVGELSIDYARRQATLAGEPVELTNVLTHGLLLQRVWGPERVGEGWLLRNVVKVLRRKLGDDAANPRYIFTEPRVGYRMAVGEVDEND